MGSTVIVPIFVCVVLPVAIVLIISLTKMNADNKRKQIIIKALEANKDIDTDKIIEAFRKPERSAREILNARLLHGCMFSLIGIGLAIVGIVNLCTGSPFPSDPVTVPFVFGGIALAIGISYLIVFFVTRNQEEPSETK